MTTRTVHFEHFVAPQSWLGHYRQSLGRKVLSDLVTLTALVDCTEDDDILGRYDWKEQRKLFRRCFSLLYITNMVYLNPNRIAARLAGLHPSSCNLEYSLILNQSITNMFGSICRFFFCHFCLSKMTQDYFTWNIEITYKCFR